MGYAAPHQVSSMETTSSSIKWFVLRGFRNCGFVHIISHAWSRFSLHSFRTPVHCCNHPQSNSLTSGWTKISTSFFALIILVWSNNPGPHPACDQIFQALPHILFGKGSGRAWLEATASVLTLPHLWLIGDCGDSY